MSRGAWVGLLVAAVAAVIAIGFVSSFFERTQRSVDFGYSPQARQNDYLAATRFLTRMGIPAQTMASPTPQTRLPATDDVLLLTTKRLTVVPETQRALLAWVKGGGHLIVAARTGTVVDGFGDVFDRFNQIATRDDPLFDALGLELVEIDLEREERDEYGPFGVDFPAAEDFVWVDFDPAYRLGSSDPRFQPLAGDGEAAVALSGSLGAGRISVIADRKPLHNRRIGDQQHALFLWHLVRLHAAAVETDGPGTVWIISDDDMPALPAWLWQHAPELVISLLLTALLALAAVSRRFGPLQGLAPPVRRSVVEHLRASGGFLWRFGYHDTLLRGLQQDLRRELALKHPATAGLDPAQAAAHLATLVAMPEATIRQALTPVSNIEANEFTGTVRVLTALSKQL